jgi:hypothetical protein
MKTLNPKELQTLIKDTITDWMVEEDCALEWWACSYLERFEKLHDGDNFWSLSDVGSRDGDLTLHFNLEHLHKKALAKARRSSNDI